jgi:hypothetical protein
MIVQHRYDSGPENTHGPCIADGPDENACGQPESEHLRSEYPGPEPKEPADLYDLSYGDMHEPPAYPASKLDWSDPDTIIDRSVD